MRFDVKVAEAVVFAEADSGLSVTFATGAISACVRLGSGRCEKSPAGRVELMWCCEEKERRRRELSKPDPAKSSL